MQLSLSWNMIHDEWNMIHDTWCMKHDIKHDTWYIWCMKHDAWIMIHDAWNMMNETWYMIHAAEQLNDAWHLMIPLNCACTSQCSYAVHLRAHLYTDLCIVTQQPEFAELLHLPLFIKKKSPRNKTVSIWNDAIEKFEFTRWTGDCAVVYGAWMNEDII